MIITSAKITGNPEKGSWSQVYETKPEDIKLAFQKGHLIVVLATHFSIQKNQDSKEGIETMLIGREVFSTIHKEYFQVSTRSALDCLTASVKAVLKPSILQSLGRLEIAAMACIKDVVYLVVYGGARILLYRQGSLFKIVSSSSEELLTASGYACENDIYLVGTSNFFTLIPPGILKGALSSLDIESVVENLAPIIHGKKGFESYAAALVKFEKDRQISALKRQKEELKSKKAFYLRGSRKLVSLIDKLLALFPKRKIVVKDDLRVLGGEKKKKMTAQVGILLIVILFVSIFFGERRRIELEEKQKYASKLSQASHEYAEATALAQLNPIRARELILSARSIVLELEKEKIKDSQLEELANKIKEDFGRITGTYEVGSDLFLDLSLVSSGFKGSKISLSSARILVLDQEGQRLVEIEPATKKTRILAGPDLIPGSVDIAAYAGRSFVLTRVGLFEVVSDKSKLVLEKDWSEDVLIASYAGNIYILDREASVIKRYPGLASGNFGGGVNWLAQDVKPDLTKVQSWSIDGSIWVLLEDGKIKRFVWGRPESFVTSGQEKEIGKRGSLFSSEETKYLYILDTQNNRVVVFDKSGLFKAEYVFEKSKEASQIVVSEVEKKAILLSSDKLYSFELKHLD